MGLELAISLVLLLVGIAILVGIHIWIVRRAFRRRDEEEQAVVGDDADVEMIISREVKKMMMSMSVEELKALPCFDYKDGGAAESCVVCLEELRVGESCKVLPNCRHSFHCLCIDSWLMMTPFCPVCRTCVHLQKVAQVLDPQLQEIGSVNVH